MDLYIIYCIFVWLFSGLTFIAYPVIKGNDEVIIKGIGLIFLEPLTLIVFLVFRKHFF